MPAQKMLLIRAYRRPSVACFLLVCLSHQGLSEKHLVTDEEGKQWLDFGKVKICLD